jgi:hypothetical protein
MKGTGRMKLFRGHHTPEDVGARTYESLRAGIASAGPLSFLRLVGDIGREPDGLPETAAGEAMLGGMFGALMAVERSTSRWIGKGILDGLLADFRTHLQEQGASAQQVKEWEGIATLRIGEYRQAMEGYAGLEPPWRLGRAFLWNLTGVRDYNALAIKAATAYLLASRDRAQEVLNEYGPTIIASPER